MLLAPSMWLYYIKISKYEKQEKDFNNRKLKNSEEKQNFEILKTNFFNSNCFSNLTNLIKLTNRLNINWN